MFHAWFSERTEADGVQIEVNTPNLRLLKVIDRHKLRNALEGFLQQHSWSEFFRIVNPQHWWSQAQLESVFGAYPPALRDVHLADLFTVLAVAISRREDLTVVRVWWKPEHFSDSPGCEMFFHLLDGDGSIINAQSIGLSGRASPEDAKHDIRLDVIVFPNSNFEAKTLGIRHKHERRGSASEVEEDAIGAVTGYLLSLP